MPLPGVPFHPEANVINNFCGVVVDYEGDPVPGLYCSGWVKRGPSGIIGTNIPDSRETVASLIKDARVSAVQWRRLPHAQLTHTLRHQWPCWCWPALYPSC